MNKLKSPRVVLCDLDGVVWLAHQPISGSVSAIERLRSAGIRVLFVTNNSFSTLDEQYGALSAIGIEANRDVVTSAMSATTALQPNWRVLVCGGKGLIEEVRSCVAETVVAYQARPITGTFDAVVVGFHREFDYQVLTDALTAINGGAVLIGSNYDPTYPTPNGPIPGGGSIVAAIEKASGVEALITGKPCEPMANIVRRMCPGVTEEEMVMVGDRDDTDGAFARTMGCRFALVLSGVSTAADGGAADIVAATLGDVATILLNE